jgi:hypothetical protein
VTRDGGPLFNKEADQERLRRLMHNPANIPNSKAPPTRRPRKPINGRLTLFVVLALLAAFGFCAMVDYGPTP